MRRRDGLPVKAPPVSVDVPASKEQADVPEPAVTSPDIPDETPPASPPPAPHTTPRDSNRTLRMAILCVLLAAGAVAILAPAIRSATGGGGDRSPGEVLGDAILEGGLPSLGGSPAGADTSSSDTDTSPAETDADIPGGTDTESTSPDSTPESLPTGLPVGTDTDSQSPDTVPAVTDSDTADTDRESDLPPPDTVGTDPSESDTDPESTEDSEPDTSPDTYPDTAPATESSSPPDTLPDPDTDTSPETPPETLPVTETDPTTEPDSEPVPEMPAGAFPIVSEDLSAPDRSVGYIQSTADRLPPSIPGEGTRLWSTSGVPTVLIVHTHPYEGYHDGGGWYDPATGALAQTNAPGDPDGVVALGAALTRILREAGVTVVHLRVPVSEGESAAATYARTEESVRYYCELYPDIGLVLDLRRSAELTETGEILRTLGQYEGNDTAQVRLSVSADRATAAVSRDIAVAVALRQALWAEEPTLSRPVWAKSGDGLAGELDRVAVLTVELGSAGNSYAEAERLICPLGNAIAELVKK